MNGCKEIKYGFIPPHSLSPYGDSAPILAAFSGGADSSAMLYMLKAYCDKTGARLYAAHVNHGIRGEEADRDEEFCKRTAEKLGIKIFVKRANVPEIAKMRKLSVETAAREIRYEFFGELMEKYSIPLLAVAHNADDNFETILFNISRGSGLSGVCGIPQTRDFAGGMIVRPILGINKADINSYCSENNIEYVTDSTNTDTDYSRNRIRSLVIPELKRICPAAEKAAARMSESLRQDSLCLESMADWFLSQTREGLSLPTEKINGSPSAITSRALMTLYRTASGGAELEYTHVKALLELSEKSVPHSAVSLPMGVRAEVENGWLTFTTDAPAPKNSRLDEYFVPLCDGVNEVSQINAEIIIGETQKDKNIYKKSIKLTLDSDKIKGTLSVRERRPQDKLRMLGCSKSIKKLMCDMKIPCELRPRLPIVCDDEGIVAVPFVGVADRCYVKDRVSAKGALEVFFGLK